MHGARNIGGGEHSIYFLIRNLRRDLFNPIVFYANENDIVAKLRVDGIRLVKIKLNPKMTSIYRSEINTMPWMIITRLVYIVSGMIHVASQMRKNNVDILHPHDNLSKIIGGIAGRITGIRVVTHCRDGLEGSFVSKILRVIYNVCTDSIIAVSEKTKQSLCLEKQALLKKTKVIYNGVDLAIYDPERVNGNYRELYHISKSGIVITIIGVLEKYKGHIYLFQALKLLKQDDKYDFTCLVIGDGREKDCLHKYANHENIDDSIVFLNYQKSIPEFLKITDILVIPSIEQEAFPRVALESMAMKVPVVCTDFGGLPEAIDNSETGFVVPVKSPNDVYEKLKYLMENRKVRDVMGGNGRRKVVDKFGIENNVRFTEEVYLNVIAC